ncbi:unnamed protein product [Lactuca virosa]|uniref:BTB domain-containing protein n=1 Tax=Lactuca virosa TaxID=75947 RepID=A0AAU9NEA9_9ASTR|nr:unnamed protein product [Lactuca virosa]
MRETLTLSHKCCLSITTAYFKEVVHEEDEELPLDIDIDIDELRKRLLFPPARNVQQLSFQTGRDQCMWERSLFFNAFFEICHPEHVFAKSDIRFRNNNHFCRLMLREVLEKKTKPADWSRYLKHVQIRTDPHKKWKTLTNSRRSFLENGSLHFKLKWC